MSQPNKHLFQEWEKFKEEIHESQRAHCLAATPGPGEPGPGEPVGKHSMQELCIRILQENGANRI